MLSQRCVFKKAQSNFCFIFCTTYGQLDKKLGHKNNIMAYSFKWYKKAYDVYQQQQIVYDGGMELTLQQYIMVPAIKTLP